MASLSLATLLVHNLGAADKPNANRIINFLSSLFFVKVLPNGSIKEENHLGFKKCRVYIIINKVIFGNIYSWCKDVLKKAWSAYL